MDPSADPPRPDDTARFAVRDTYERSLAPGEIVFDEGDPGDTLFVIHAGQIELTRTGADGPRLLARLGPGDFFGEMAVLLGGGRRERATAVGEAELLELDGKTFEGLCVEHPEIAIRVIQRLAARSIELERRLAALGVDDLLRPVVRVLLRHAEHGPDGARVALRLRGVAEGAGLSMLEAHRALGQLFDRRLLRLDEDVLFVTDPEALAAALDVD